MALLDELLENEPPQKGKVLYGAEAQKTFLNAWNNQLEVLKALRWNMIPDQAERFDEALKTIGDIILELGEVVKDAGITLK